MNDEYRAIGPSCSSVVVNEYSAKMKKTDRQVYKQISPRFPRVFTSALKFVFYCFGIHPKSIRAIYYPCIYMLSTKLFIINLVHQGSNVLNRNAHIITVFQDNLRVAHSANSRTGTGHNYGSPLKCRALGQERDGLGDIENHFTVPLSVLGCI